jgi:hypothetical protein
MNWPPLTNQHHHVWSRVNSCTPLSRHLSVVIQKCAFILDQTIDRSNVDVRSIDRKVPLCWWWWWCSRLYHHHPSWEVKPSLQHHSIIFHRALYIQIKRSKSVNTECRWCLIWNTMRLRECSIRYCHIDYVGLFAENRQMSSDWYVSKMNAKQIFAT